MQNKDIARIIRVNQAGEYGAKRIYAGQMAMLKQHQSYPVIAHMAKQEEEHLAYFNREMVKRHVRPTALFPLWHVAGYALGAATALLGEKAAMACTVAVEEVIDAHYAKQLQELQGTEPELEAHITRFREEEIEHKDTALAHQAEEAPAYLLLSNMVKLGSKAAIWLASRI